MNLANLLFGTYRRDVLNLLLLRPEESWHVREIARRVSRPANTLYRELVALAEAGLLVREPRGNQVHYRANPACPIYEELRAILRKTTGMADVIGAALAPLAGRIKSAFVYGSMAGGTERAGSDVDLMIVGEIKFEEALLALSGAEGAVRREINPHVYGVKEFRSKATGRDGFIARVLHGPRIFVIGDDHDLEKLAGHRAAQSA